jgi:hypothetical protein
MSAYTNHGKTWARRNCGRKSTLIERDRRTVRRIIWKNQNYCIRTEYSSWRSCFHGVSLRNPTSRVGLQLRNLWLLKVMLRCVNDGVTTIKPGYQKLEMPTWYGKVSRLSRCSLHQLSIRLENIQEAYSPECLFPTAKHGRGSVLVWAAASRYSVLCWSDYCPSWPNYCKGVRAQVGQSRASHDADVISEQRSSFPRRQCHHPHRWNCSVVDWIAWKWTSTSSLASTITGFEHHWTTVVSFGDWSEEHLTSPHLQRL